uniref:Uncharacterized protein n=1 Tax=Arundo donax TaxID=35708 RepID=A0A0A9CX71_ARUDO
MMYTKYTIAFYCAHYNWYITDIYNISKHTFSLPKSNTPNTSLNKIGK